MRQFFVCSVISLLLMTICSSSACAQVYRYEKRLNIDYTWPKRYQTSEIDTTLCTEFTYQLWRNKGSESYAFIDDYFQNGFDPNCTVLVHSTYVKPPLFRSEKESGTIHWRATPFQLACSFGDVKMVEKLLEYEPNPNRLVDCCFDSVGKRINDSYMPVLEIALDNKWRSKGDGTKECRQDSSVYNYLINHGVWSEEKKTAVSDKLIEYMKRYRNAYFQPNRAAMDSIKALCDSLGSIQLRDVRYLFKQSIESNIPFVQQYLYENQHRLDTVNFSHYVEVTPAKNGIIKTKPTYKEEVIPWKLYFLVYPEFPMIEPIDYFYEKGMLSDSDLRLIATMSKTSKQGIKQLVKAHNKNGGKQFQSYYRYYFQVQELEAGSAKRIKLEEKMKQIRVELKEING